MVKSSFAKALQGQLVQAIEKILAKVSGGRLSVGSSQTGKLARLARILVLAGTVMALNTMGYTLASSLFVSHIGASGLPLSYVLVGLASMPVYGVFARVADRIPHPLLFRYWSVAAAGVALLFRLLLFWDVQPIYYALYIGVYFQWTLQLDILLPTLISDYFTSREYNRRAPFITMAQAVGGLLGGGLVSLLASFVATPDILLLLPVLYLLVLVQVWHLERREKPIPSEETERQTDEPPPSPLQLAQQFPIVKFLAGSTFLWILLYSLAEYLYFGIYAETFADNPQGLTSFLGGFSAVNCALQMLLLFFLTRKLIERLGVARVNSIYPVATFFSFLGLWLFPSFPVAVLAHFNNSTIDTAIDQPAYTLVYNPIPNRYLGQVRAVTNGLCYSLGLALTGGLLWVAALYVNLQTIALVGLLVGAFFVGVRYKLGQNYYRSLLSGLRSKTDKLDLKAVREGLVQLPESQSAQLAQMLKRGETKEKKEALELATYLRKPSRLLTEIDALLSEADVSLQRRILSFFSKTTQDTGVTRYLRDCLASSDEERQLMALEALMARRNPLDAKDLERLSHSDRPTIRALVAVVAQQRGDLEEALRQRCAEIWQSDMDDETKKVVIRGIRHTGNPSMIPQLLELLQGASVDVQIEVLKGMAELKPDGDATLGELAVRFLEHPSPQVRVAAIDLLGAIRLPEFWEFLARGLEDLDVNVRLRSASALANYEEYNLEQLAQMYLFGARADVSEAAVAAIAYVQTSQALHFLEDYLQQDYEAADRIQAWWQRIPARAESWQPLVMVLRDRSQQIVNRVFHVLSCLGSRHALTEVRQMLHTRDERKRANAVETLASIPHRRYIMPILPLVEYPEGRSPVAELDSDRAKPVLEEFVCSEDRWVRVGALLVWAHYRYPLPETVQRERDRIVKSVVKEAFSEETAKSISNLSIDRVLFLKTTSLFRDLSLDEVWSLDRGFQLKTYEEGDAICREGEVGNTLYVLYRGRLHVTSQMEESDRCLTPGSYFGDSSLFGEFPYGATAIAESSCQLLCLTKDSFDVLIDVLPKLPSCFALAALDSEF
ncbi:MFS transporter [Baaleninema sp.]|uniref:MFS transporter n=1 Tax=Baaleninema sp. TaxID=3101197 RepID=UPI003D038C43